MSAAASYVLRARDKARRVVGPVARFPLGNGARLERLNCFGEISANGLKPSHGLMGNCLYDLAQIETNPEGFAGRSPVVAAALSPLWTA